MGCGFGDGGVGSMLVAPLKHGGGISATAAKASAAAVVRSRGGPSADDVIPSESPRHLIGHTVLVRSLHAALELLVEDTPWGHPDTWRPDARLRGLGVRVKREVRVEVVMGGFWVGGRVGGQGGSRARARFRVRAKLGLGRG